jgi:hypothetical protein
MSFPDKVEAALVTYHDDPWAAGAAETLNKPMLEVTREEQHRFKVAFHRAFLVQAASLVHAALESEARCMVEHG